MMMQFLRKHSRSIGRSISVLCYLFVGYALVRYFKDIYWEKLLETEVNWAIIAAALVAETGTRFLLPPIWVFLLKEFGQPIRRYWMLNFVYAKAWLGRYLPGKVAWVGGKIYFASQEGLDLTILTLASPLESVIQITANLMLGLALATAFSPTILDSKVVMFSIASLVILLGCTYPPIFNWLVRLAYKILRKRDLDVKYTLRVSTFWKTFALFILFSFACGIPLSLTCKAVAPDFQMVKHFLYLVSAATLSVSIGMLALFAPGGLGVREGLLSVFFAPLFPKESVLLIVVLLRLIAVVGDLGFVALSHLFKNLASRQETSQNRMNA